MSKYTRISWSCYCPIHKSLAKNREHCLLYLQQKALNNSVQLSHCQVGQEKAYVNTIDYHNRQQSSRCSLPSTVK